MEYNGEKKPETDREHLFSAEKYLIDNIAAMTAVDNDTDAEIVELLFSLRDVIKSGSDRRMFNKVGRQYVRDVLYSISVPPSETFAFHLSELARDLTKNGILGEGEMVADMSMKALEMSQDEPSGQTLLRMINNLFWVGFYLAKERWFLEATGLYRTYKKTLKKDKYQEELENILHYWLPVSEVSDWGDSHHKLNFEIMMIRFAQGEI